jgi:ADP-heptose:LPS heptosyltransferase
MREGAAATRILVVRAGALGDTLMATPVLRALQHEHPGCELDFLCAPAAAPLLASNPRVSRLFTLERRNLPFALSPEKWGLAARLRSRAYDLAVLLESAPRYEELLRHARPRSLRSFRDIQFDPREHSIVNNLRVAGVAEVQSPRPKVAGHSLFEPQAREVIDCDPALDMELYVSGEDERAIAELLGIAPLGTRLVGLHPGYGPRTRKTRDQAQRLKGWDIGNFGRLAHMLIERGFTVVLTGSRQDHEDAERIAEQLPGRFFQLAGRTTVGQLAALIQKLELLVAVDSGPAHMAAALGVPLVVLWGPARLEQVRPLSSRSPVCVVRHPVSCAPCYDTPRMKTCRRNICMQGISPERVLREADALLRDSGIEGSRD